MFDDEIRRMIERMKKMFGDDEFAFNNEFSEHQEDNGLNKGPLDISNEIENEGKKEKAENIFDIYDDRNPFKNSKSYSISYKFGTGMDNPEIRVNGNLSPEKVQEFLKMMQGRQEFQKPPLNQVHSISSQIPNEPQDSIIDIYEDEEFVHVVLEMPGVKKEDINLLATPRQIEINGRTVELPTEIDMDQATSRLKNGILQVKLKKKQIDARDKKKLQIE